MKCKQKEHKYKFACATYENNLQSYHRLSIFCEKCGNFKHTEVDFLNET